jgi:cobalt-zinc-cadmium efflux system outer membrane protein
MYRPFFPLALVVLGLPAFAQTTTAVPEISTSRAVVQGASFPKESVAALTLETAIALAMQANPQLAGARHEVQAIAGTVLQAGLRPNPALELGQVDTRRATRETTAQLNQTIELGGKRARRIEAAERGQDAATADLRTRIADVRAGVTTAFNDVLTAQERVRLAQESLAVAARVTNTVAKRVQAGKVSPVDETRARVAEANVRLEAVRVDGELATARKTLSGYWGNVMPRFERALGNLEVLPVLPDWNVLVAGLGNAPSLSRARIEMDRRRALLKVEQSRRTPDVTVAVGMKRSQELGLNQAVFGLSIPLPLFDRNQGNVLEALRRVDKAGDEFASTQTETHKELAQAYQELDTARQEAQSLSGEILPGAQSAYDAAVKGFDFGKFAYFDVLDAQRTLILAKSQYLRALQDARRAAANIDRLAGTTAPGVNQ